MRCPVTTVDCDGGRTQPPQASASLEGASSAAAERVKARGKKRSFMEASSGRAPLTLGRIARRLTPRRSLSLADAETFHPGVLRRGPSGAPPRSFGPPDIAPHRRGVDRLS